MIMIEDEVHRVMSNPDNVIMSDDLVLALGDEDNSEEYLSLDENVFVCEVQRAKRNTRSSWEFQIVVHGLTFRDFVSFETAIFQYGTMKFLLTDQLEFINETKTITARATRIFKSNE